MERAFERPSDTGSHRCRWSQRCARLLALADFLGAVWVVVVGADVPLYTKYPGLTSSSQDGCSPGKRQDTHPESTRYHTRTKRHDVNGNENETSTHIPPECGLRVRGFDVGVRAYHSTNRCHATFAFHSGDLPLTQQGCTGVELNSANFSPGACGQWGGLVWVGQRATMSYRTCHDLTAPTMAHYCVP